MAPLWPPMLFSLFAMVLMRQQVLVSLLLFNQVVLFAIGSHSSGNEANIAMVFTGIRHFRH